MALNFDNLTFNTFDKFTYVSNATGAVYFIAEDIQNGTVRNGEEVIYQTGKAGRRIGDMKKNKTAGFEFTNGYVSLNQLAAQVGATVEEAATATLLAPCIEVVAAGTGGTSATTTYEAEGTAGAEILALYKKNPDGSQGAKYTQAATASATAFAYATKTITLPTSVFAEGDEIIVYYNYNTKGKKITNSGDNFSLNGRAIIEGTAKSACDNETLYYYKWVIPYASGSGAFEIGIGGDQTTHPFTCESVPNKCSNNEYWFLIVPENS